MDTSFSSYVISSNALICSDLLNRTPEPEWGLPSEICPDLEISSHRTIYWVIYVGKCLADERTYRVSYNDFVELLIVNLEELLSITHKQFDSVAWAYDLFMRSWRLYQDELVLDLLKLQGNEYIVDLGGGTGHYSVLLSPYCREATVVDESAAMLARIQHLGNVKVVRADIADTGLASQSFDAALLLDVIHHVDDQDKALSEAYRLVKPGGRLLLLDFDAASFRTRLLGAFEKMLFRHVSYRTPSAMTEFCAQHGFDVIERVVRKWYYALLMRKI